MSNERLAKIIINTIRIIIGTVLLYNSITKALDPVGFVFEIEHKVKDIEMYQFFEPVVFMWATLFILLEFTLGVSFLFKLLLEYSIVVTFILFTIFLPFSFWIALKNPYYSGISCNPFDLSNKLTFIIDSVLWILSLILLINKNCLSHSKLIPKRQLSWVLTSALSIFIFILINYSFLPIIDFNCFPRGTNLNEKLENYYFDVKHYHNYRVKLLYFNKKNKKFRYFRETYIPWRDTNWVWINTKLIPIRRTYKGSISRFCIVNSLGRDITDSLLHIKEPVVLITSYNLKHINARGFRKAVEFARTFRDQYFPTAYCLTSATQRTVDSIIDLTGAYDIEFCFTDTRFLKSLARSNPEILILKNGFILMKRHYNLLPNLNKINFYMSKTK